MEGDENNHPFWLGQITKFKRKESNVIPDRLYHRTHNSVHQENPIIEPFVWDRCRPTRPLKDGAKESEWQDTYDLVCNFGVPIFDPTKSNETRLPEHNVSLNKKKLTELQKLCIVVSMHRAPIISQNAAMAAMAEGENFESHLDFVHTRTHLLHGQPCTVLQTRHFRLMDLKPWTDSHYQGRVVSLEDIITEVSQREYNEYRSISPNAMIRADELVFDSKGKRSANLSTWFDADIVPCCSKKASTKHIGWKIANDRSGSLFCMPDTVTNKTFERNLPSSVPYVAMQPIDDFKAGHDLIEAILEHRIGTILYSMGSLNFDKFPNGKRDLDDRFKELETIFTGMKKRLTRWVWPKTSNMDHIPEPQETRNTTVYSPAVTPDQDTVIPAIWSSFIKNLRWNVDLQPDSKRRLDVFHCITVDKSSGKDLPRIHHAKPSLIKKNPSSLSEATWRELLLGENGPWKKAIESYEAEKNSTY